MDKTMVQLLLDHGGSVYSNGGYYGAALQAAAFNRDIGVSELLLDHGADVNVQGGKFGNLLQAAIVGMAESTADHDLRLVKVLLQRGASVNGNYAR